MKIQFKKYIKLFIFFYMVIISGCNDGISPGPEINSTGFTGRITFLGTWPDSIARTHLVVFKNLLLTSADFNILNIQFVSFEIPNGISYYNYSSLDSSYISIKTGEYSYVAVVQSKSINLSLDRKDWTVAGVYYLANDTTKPGKLIIPPNTIVNNINITCDFNHPPPQPPGGIK